MVMSTSTTTVTKDNLETMLSEMESLEISLETLRGEYESSITTIGKQLNDIDFNLWEDSISTALQTLKDQDIKQTVDDISTDIESGGFYSMQKIVSALIEQLEHCISAKKELEAEEKAYQTYKTKYESERSKYRNLDKPTQTYYEYIKGLYDKASEIYQHKQTLQTKLTSMIRNCNSLLTQLRRVEFGTVIDEASLSVIEFNESTDTVYIDDPEEFIGETEETVEASEDPDPSAITDPSTNTDPSVITVPSTVTDPSTEPSASADPSAEPSASADPSAEPSEEPIIPQHTDQERHDDFITYFAKNNPDVPKEKIEEIYTTYTETNKQWNIEMQQWDFIASINVDEAAPLTKDQAIAIAQNPQDYKIKLDEYSGTWNNRGLTFEYEVLVGDDPQAVQVKGGTHSFLAQDVFGENRANADDLRVYQLATYSVPLHAEDLQVETISFSDSTKIQTYGLPRTPDDPDIKFYDIPRGTYQKLSRSGINIWINFSEAEANGVKFTQEEINRMNSNDLMSNFAGYYFPQPGGYALSYRVTSRKSISLSDCIYIGSSKNLAFESQEGE